MTGSFIGLALLSAGPATAEDGLDEPEKQEDSSGMTTTDWDGERVVATAPGIRRVKFVSASGSNMSSTVSNFRSQPGGRDRIAADNTKEEADEKSSKIPCGTGTPVKGNPIDIASGNKLEFEVDFESGGDMPLSLKRTYNFHWYGVGLLGYRWLTSFDYRLSFGGGTPESSTCYASPSIPQCATTGSETQVWVHRPDGTKLRFNRSSDGLYYEEKPTPLARIQRQPDGRWILYTAEGGVETYSAGGHPQQILNESGVGWTFSYGGLNNTQLQSVTHTSTRRVTFEWVGDELRKIRDPMNRAYSFAYIDAYGEGRHVLKTMTTPGALPTTVTYHYTSEPGEQLSGVFRGLTGKSYNGERYSWFTYDQSYNATSSQHAGGVEGYIFEHTYNADGTKTVVETNPLGKKATYVFKDEKVLNVTGQPSNSCAGAYRETTYDANGYRDLVADFNGNFTNYDYSAAGLLQARTEGFGSPVARTSNYTWNAAGSKITEVTIPNYSKSSYTYTSQNFIATLSKTNLSSVGISGQTVTTSYSYAFHANGLLSTASVDGPLANDTVVYSYNAFGDLVEIKNGLEQRTAFSGYNDLGQVGRVVGPNGDITEYTYDDRGRVETMTTYPDGATPARARYHYDSFSRLEAVELPDNRVHRYEYDPAWRITREFETEAGGTYAVRKYSYNNASLVTSVVTERTTAVHAPTAQPTISVPSIGPNGAYRISWTDVVGSESYALDESTNGLNWTNVGNTPARFQDFVSKPVGTYYYRVKGCNAAGCAPVSYHYPVEVIYTPAAPATPNVPSQSTSGAYTVSWNSISNANRYVLEENAGAGWVTIQDSVDVSKPLTGKNAGTYSYRVMACNVVACGPYSGIVTVVEIDPPGAPPNIFAPASNPNAYFTVSWTGVAGSTYYRLQESAYGGAWTTILNANVGSIGLSRVSGPLAYRVAACNQAGCGTYSSVVTVQHPVYDAQFVWQSIPALMYMGDSATVTVQMRNTGNTTWTAAEAYRLGSQTSQDNTRWGLGRVDVSGTVPPGQVATFTFQITAPFNLGEGAKVFHWQMVRDGVTWFGATSQLAYIGVASVGGGDPDPDPNPCGSRPNCHEN